MKLLVLLFCLCLLKSLNASEDFWCVFKSPYTGMQCNACYNSEIKDYKCTGVKIEGCVLTEQWFGDIHCSVCEQGYYSRMYVQKICKKVPQDKLVENCTVYEITEEDQRILCKSCGRGFMPSITQDKCIVSDQTPCDKLTIQVSSLFGVKYWCDQCPIQFKKIVRSITEKDTCEPTEDEGCMNGGPATSCTSICDYRLGFEVSTIPGVCVKRQEVLLA